MSSRMQQNSVAILIVEDNGLIRMDAVDMAQSEGYRVFEAATADQAIGILEAHPDIRLVFTDIEMPGSMDGLKLAHTITRRWPPIRMIVTSGKVPRDKANLPQGGLFFAKPYRHAQITAAMRSLLAA